MAGVDEQLAAGTRFGSYVIVRRLGRGSYGSVYEALRQPLNRRVALKVLHRAMLDQEHIVRRFLREAELVAAIEHPHIVAVFDVGTVDELPYLAMEFLEGESLGAHIKACGAMTVEETVDILLPIVAAVGAVHERGVIHRDIKPDNILLARSATGEVVPRLLDFGIAKETSGDLGLTHTNALMGTPFYMSPEQAREARSIDARTDQWSLAVIAWQCVAGRKLFRGNSLLDVLNAVAGGPIEPLRLSAPTAPEAFERALLGALQRDPARRYPSVWDLGQRLLPFASPLTQSRWRDHFAAHASPWDLATPDPPAIDDVPTSPSRPAPVPLMAEPALSPSPAHTTLPLPPRVVAATLAASAASTLEPRAMTLPGPRPKPSRAPLVVGAFGAFAVAVLVGLGLGTRTRAPSRVAAPPPVPMIATPAPAPVVEAPAPVVEAPAPVVEAPAPVVEALAPVAETPVAQGDATQPRVVRPPRGRPTARPVTRPVRARRAPVASPAAPAAGRGDDNI